MSNFDIKKFLKLTNGFNFNIKDIELIKGGLGLSKRKYFRIKNESSKSYILMDCSLESQTLKNFIKIQNKLQAHKFSVPEIFILHEEMSCAILEDFGEKHIKDLIQENRSNIRYIEVIYKKLIDLIIELQKLPSEDLLIKQNFKNPELFIKYYLPFLKGSVVNLEEKIEYSKIWEEIMQNIFKISESFVISDYHSENIMCLLQRKYSQTFGLLDFQDAFLGCISIDLMSLLQDVRINVSEDLVNKMINYFVEKKNLDLEKFLVNYHIFGARHQLDILGKFYKFSLDHPQIDIQEYLKLSMKYLKINLQHPVLNSLKIFLSRYL
ncbi:MAG: phosphotransferase [Rickettsia sp.]|nr:phosphotransferase [Rickettsia sp.]